MEYDLLCYQKRRVWVLPERGSNLAAHPVTIVITQPQEEVCKPFLHHYIPNSLPIYQTNQQQKACNYHHRYADVTRSHGMFLSVCASVNRDGNLHQKPMPNQQTTPISILSNQRVMRSVYKAMLFMSDFFPKTGERQDFVGACFPSIFESNSMQVLTQNDFHYCGKYELV